MAAGSAGEFASVSTPLPVIDATSAHSRVVRRSPYNRFGKRGCDIVLGGALLVLLLPLMLAVAAGVLLTSGWPVLYASERFGRGARSFSMWKFRSMIRYADQELERWRETHPERAGAYDTHFKLKDDPRVTRFGRFLRRSSLDELPQFWNVVRGDMSLVGPRPYLPSLAPDEDVAAAVLSVRPAITGPFQTRGRSAISPRARMEMDVAYAAGQTLLGDAAYLAQTLRPLLRMDGD